MTVTGKPSISDLKSNDVRPLSVAISNIRQRIEAIEGSLGSVESTVNQSSTTGSTQFNVLRQQIAALQVALAALEAAVAELAADGSQTLLAVRSFTSTIIGPRKAYCMFQYSLPVRGCQYDQALRMSRPRIQLSMLPPLLLRTSMISPWRLNTG